MTPHQGFEETEKILNLVFMWADDRTEFKVDVSVGFEGEENCPGLKKGVSEKYNNYSKIYVQLVDVSNLDIGDRVFMHDIEVHVHPSLKVLNKNETMRICKIGHKLGESRTCSGVGTEG